jgi:hypothetical protein
VLKGDWIMAALSLISLAQIKQHQARVLARVGAKTITPSENGTE